MKYIAYSTVLLPATFMGADVEIEFDLGILSYATDASGLYGPPEFYDPGEGAAFDVISVVIREDCPGPTLGPDFKATGALEETLIEHYWRDLQSAADALEEEPYEYDEDYYRDER